MRRNDETVHICPRCEGFFRASFLKVREARPKDVPMRTVCDVCGRKTLCVEYRREGSHEE